MGGVVTPREAAAKIEEQKKEITGEPKNLEEQAISLLSLFLAGSKYGNIVLGKPDEKPKYSFFAWGCMMFTCGLAADILFYSLSALLFLEIIRWESRFQVQLISFRSIMKMEIYII